MTNRSRADGEGESPTTAHTCGGPVFGRLTDGCSRCGIVCTFGQW